MNILIADVVVRTDKVISTGDNSGGLLQLLLQVLLVGICAAAIWWVGRWFILKFTLGDVAMTAWSGFFLLIGLFLLVNFVMSLGGHALFRLW